MSGIGRASPLLCLHPTIRNMAVGIKQCLRESLALRLGVIGVRRLAPAFGCRFHAE